MSTAKVKTGRNGSLVVADVDSNPAANDLGFQPAQLIVDVTIEGTSRILFHRYDCEAVGAKAGAGKGSKEKKTDNVESYTYRDDDGYLCVPAEALHGSLIQSARSFQDPRSPRKSAMDLIKAGLLVMPDMIRITRDGSPMRDWEFTDTRRVVVQRSAVSRTRPGVNAGWRLAAQIHILTPGLISVELLRSLVVNAGATVGLCDFRPRFGRFQAVRIDIAKLAA